MFRALEMSVDVPRLHILLVLQTVARVLLGLEGVGEQVRVDGADVVWRCLPLDLVLSAPDCSQQASAWYLLYPTWFSVFVYG